MSTPLARQHHMAFGRELVRSLTKNRTLTKQPWFIFKDNLGRTGNAALVWKYGSMPWYHDWQDNFRISENCVVNYNDKDHIWWVDPVKRFNGILVQSKYSQRSFQLLCGRLDYGSHSSSSGMYLKQGGYKERSGRSAKNGREWNVLQNKLTTLTTTNRRCGGTKEKLMIWVGI